MTEPIAYKNATDHLGDELRKVELYIRIALATRKEAGLNTERNLGLGAYVGDEDVRALLDFNAGSESEPVRVLLEDLRELRAAITERLEVSREQERYLPADWLRALMDISDFEWDVLMICLAPSLDPRFKRLYSYIQDDVARQYASQTLVLQLMTRDIAQAAAVVNFLSAHPIRGRWKILREEHGGRGEQLIVDPHVVNYLTGSVHLHPRTAPWARLEFPSDDDRDNDDQDDDNQGDDNQGDDGRANESEAVIGLAQLLELSRSKPENIFALFTGPAGSGRGQAARRFRDRADRLLVELRLGDLIRESDEPAEMLDLVLRDVVLRQAVLLIRDFDLLLDSDNENVAAFARRFSRDAAEYSSVTIALTSKARPFERTRHALYPVLKIPPPDYEQRLTAWRAEFEKFELARECPPPTLFASMFRFTPGVIRKAMAAAADHASLRSPALITEDDLLAGCRAQCSTKLDSLARRILPVHGWDDLILPVKQLESLREVYLYYRNRRRILDEWGFDRKMSTGKGRNVLFAGPPGTGKTMAASIIAARLRLELYKIDLAGIVSKFIGETEKNLAALFKEAEASHAILFFDEADALFGKRTEVKDAHDRYANIETSYLLQKMDEYEGITILATNLKQNMDEAFLRRLHTVVDFPFPDSGDRNRIWRGIFPAETPLGADMDYEFLSERIQMAGGNIKNIALTAAVFAADEAQAVSMRHLLQATRREYDKMAKPFLGREFEPYYEPNREN